MRVTIENLEEVEALPPGKYHTEVVSASWEEIVVRYNPERTESLIQVTREFPDDSEELEDAEFVSAADLDDDMFPEWDAAAELADGARRGK